MPLVCPALCFSHGPGNEDVMLADDGIVGQVVLPRPVVHLGGFVLVHHPERYVCEGQFMLCTFAQQ